MARPDVVIARVWDGVPNLRNGGTAVGVREEGLGSAALEYRVAQFRPLRAGQLLTVCSGLKALGEKTTAWTHLCMMARRANRSRPPRPWASPSTFGCARPWRSRPNAAPRCNPC